MGRGWTRSGRSGRPRPWATSPPRGQTLEPEALHRPMGIGLQAVELAPGHAGLAEPRCQRLLPCSAFSAGACSLALSGAGKPLPLGSPLHPTHLRWGCCMNYCGAPDAGGSQLQAFVGRVHQDSLPFGLPYSCSVWVQAACRGVHSCFASPVSAPPEDQARGYGH